jgi:hypothetical protein
VVIAAGGSIARSICPGPRSGAPRPIRRLRESSGLQATKLVVSIDRCRADGFCLASAAVEAGLKRYRERGVDDDISNCTNLEDMAELRESLDQLAKEFGLDFAYDIERLDEQMAEGEDPEDRYNGGTGFSRSVGATDQQVVTGEDIRQSSARYVEIKACYGVTDH